jgi:uncharacterized protein (TIGR00255 family)
MALSSMTGFANASGACEGLSWQWELRSVNGKSLDIRLRLPPGHEALESFARSAIAQQLKRGNIQATLAVASDQPAGSLVVNAHVLEQVAMLAEDLRKRLGSPPIQAEALLALRGVLDTAVPEVGEDSRHRQLAAMQASLLAAIEQLAAMRKSEGARLSTVLFGHLDRIEALTASARDNPARTPESIKRRLAEQIAKLLDASDGFDPNRLHQEAVLLATRNDIQEEVDRLMSHVAAARALIASPEPAGRKFEFLAQEFNREANTLCSKSQDPSLTQAGLDLKSVIDQLREQVLNIE